MKDADETRHAAPWSAAVKWISAVTVVALLGVAVVVSWCLPAGTPALARWAIALVPPLIVFGTLLFVVRGYVLGPGELRILRLGWQNRIPLAEVVAVAADPEAMRGSIRLCGSGGLFGFLGWFRNRTLGVYRAYATNPRNAVVIRLRQRTLLVTPENPAAFVRELNRQRGA
jgi:hypothetical protein